MWRDIERQHLHSSTPELQQSSISLTETSKTRRAERSQASFMPTWACMTWLSPRVRLAPRSGAGREVVVVNVPGPCGPRTLVASCVVRPATRPNPDAWQAEGGRTRHGLAQVRCNTAHMPHWRNTRPTRRAHYAATCTAIVSRTALRAAHGVVLNSVRQRTVRHPP